MGNSCCSTEGFPGGGSYQPRHSARYDETSVSSLGTNELRQMDHLTRASTLRGEVTEEASPFSLSMSRKFKLLKAKLTNGITDDPEQFRQEIEDSAPELRHFERKRIRDWCDLVFEMNKHTTAELAEQQERMEREEYERQQKEDEEASRKLQEEVDADERDIDENDHLSTRRKRRRIRKNSNDGSSSLRSASSSSTSTSTSDDKKQFMEESTVVEPTHEEGDGNENSQNNKPSSTPEPKHPPRNKNSKKKKENNCSSCSDEDKFDNLDEDVTNPNSRRGSPQTAAASAGNNNNNTNDSNTNGPVGASNSFNLDDSHNNTNNNNKYVKYSRQSSTTANHNNGGGREDVSTIPNERANSINNGNNANFIGLDDDNDDAHHGPNSPLEKSVSSLNATTTKTEELDFATSEFFKKNYGEEFHFHPDPEHPMSYARVRKMFRKVPKRMKKRETTPRNAAIEAWLTP